MQYRIFGRTGLKVSEIGFGCWGIGGGKIAFVHGWKYPWSQA